MALFDETVVSVANMLRFAKICSIVQIAIGFTLLGSGLATFLIPPEISVLVTPFWAGFVVMVCGKFSSIAVNSKHKTLAVIYFILTVATVAVCSTACIWIYPTMTDIHNSCQFSSEERQCLCQNTVFSQMDSCYKITDMVFYFLMMDLILCSLSTSFVITGLLLSLYCIFMSPAIYRRDDDTDSCDSLVHRQVRSEKPGTCPDPRHLIQFNKAGKLPSGRETRI